MGCATVREKLEAEMMQLKLERVEIMEEREGQLKKLEELTGRKQSRKPVPDYVADDQGRDPEMEEEIEEEEEEVEKITISKKKKKLAISKKKNETSSEIEEDEEDDDE